MTHGTEPDLDREADGIIILILIYTRDSGHAKTAQYGDSKDNVLLASSRGEYACSRKQGKRHPFVMADYHVGRDSHMGAVISLQAQLGEFHTRDRSLIPGATCQRRSMHAVCAETFASNRSVGGCLAVAGSHVWKRVNEGARRKSGNLQRISLWLLRVEFDSVP
jgi:hypothetical protein